MFIRSEPANLSAFVRLAPDKLLHNVNVMSHFVRLSIVVRDACVVDDDANHVQQVLDKSGCTLWMACGCSKLTIVLTPALLAVP